MQNSFNSSKEIGRNKKIYEVSKDVVIVVRVEKEEIKQYFWKKMETMAFPKSFNFIIKERLISICENKWLNDIVWQEFAQLHGQL